MYNMKALFSTVAVLVFACSGENNVVPDMQESTTKNIKLDNFDLYIRGDPFMGNACPSFSGDSIHGYYKIIGESGCDIDRINMGDARSYGVYLNFVTWEPGSLEDVPGQLCSRDSSLIPSDARIHLNEIGLYNIAYCLHRRDGGSIEFTVKFHNNYLTKDGPSDSSFELSEGSFFLRSSDRYLEQDVGRLTNLIYSLERIR